MTMHRVVVGAGVLAAVLAAAFHARGTASAGMPPGHAPAVLLDPPAGADRIELVGRMRLARSAQTATALAGDRVLIAGGMAGGANAVRGFEIFDAATNRVVAAGELTDPRATHTATLLADGRVLLAGGYTGEYLRSAEIYDPRTGRTTPTGSMHAGRSGHTATVLRDGTVLVTGGVGDGWSFLASAETYDPRTGRFTPTSPLRERRESHTAALLPDGRVLIAGGHRDRRENIVVYRSTEIYDPVRRSFSPGPDLGVARHKHEAVALADGRVLVLGGSDPRDRTAFTSAELYDPARNAFAPTASLRYPRYKVRDTAVRLRDGRVLVAGGGRYAEVFDPRANRFRPVRGDLGDGYSFAASALLGNGDALVIGGYDDRMRDSDGIWRFRP